jgi:uncharacterized OB-fold protein
MSFQIPACGNCGHAVWPPRLACSVCGASEWTEVDASTGAVTETVDIPGPEGEIVRLATVRLHVDRGAVPFPRDTGERNSPPVIARAEGCEAGETVTLALRDGALTASPTV